MSFRRKTVKHLNTADKMMIGK